VLVVLNKVDIVKGISQLETLQTLFPDAVSISAKSGLGLNELSEVVLQRYKGTELLVRVLSSQSNGKVQSFLRAQGRVTSETYLDSMVTIEARLGRNQLPELKRLGVSELQIIED
jgi:GTP-binding protein HflX